MTVEVDFVLLAVFLLIEMLATFLLLQGLAHQTEL
jgi:hypothetical protein